MYLGLSTSQCVLESFPSPLYSKLHQYLKTARHMPLYSFTNGVVKNNPDHTSWCSWASPLEGYISNVEFSVQWCLHL